MRAGRAGTSAAIAGDGLLNLRSAHRAVAGGEPGPEGNVTKLLLSEIGHEAAAILAALAGPDVAFLDGPGAWAATLSLMHRAMSIAGGTSEIKRNQIGERILGLPPRPAHQVAVRTNDPAFLTERSGIPQELKEPRGGRRRREARPGRLHPERRPGPPSAGTEDAAALVPRPASGGVSRLTRRPGAT